LFSVIFRDREKIAIRISRSCNEPRGKEDKIGCTISILVVEPDVTKSIKPTRQ
jgi:hypothetical protein